MAKATPLHPHRDGTLIDILVQPRASVSDIIGVHDGALRVRVAAPPVDGAANAAIIELFSKRLKVRKADVEIVSGASGRRKRVLIRGVDAAAVSDRLVCRSNSGAPRLVEPGLRRAALAGDERDEGS